MTYNVSRGMLSIQPTKLYWIIDCILKFASSKPSKSPVHRIHNSKGHSFELPRCAVELHKNLFYLDVCLNMSSSVIRYAWFCTSVCIFSSSVYMFFLTLLFFVFISCTTYMLMFFSMVTNAYTFVLCSIKITQSINQ